MKTKCLPSVVARRERTTRTTALGRSVAGVLLASLGPLLALGETPCVEVPVEISNPGFEEGKAGWQFLPNMSVVSERPHGGKSCACVDMTTVDWRSPWRRTASCGGGGLHRRLLTTSIRCCTRSRRPRDMTTYDGPWTFSTNDIGRTDMRRVLALPEVLTSANPGDFAGGGRKRSGQLKGQKR